MLTKTTDVLSVWEIAHRWFNHDPNQYNADSVPLDTQDLLRFITKLMYRHELSVFTCAGIELKNENNYVPSFEDYRVNFSECVTFTDEPVEGHEGLRQGEIVVGPDSESITNLEKVDSYLEFKERVCQPHNEAVANFPQCFEGRVFNRNELDNIYLIKWAVESMCMEHGFPLPDFWFSESEKFQATQDIAAPDLSNSTNLYTTERFERLIKAGRLAIERYWKLFDPDELDTAPNRKVVIDFLKKECKLNDREAGVIQAAIRHPSTAEGGRKS